MTDPQPGNVCIIYENDEDGDQTESQNTTSGLIPIIYENDDADNIDAQHGEPDGSNNSTLPVSNELTILSDELNSLSFGIDIVKDGQDDSLQGFESIIDHTQSPTLTISSTISIEDRTSDGNTTVDTSGGCSHYIPVVGIDADVHRDTTTDAQSPPAQSDDSTDDPAKLTLRQRLAKMEKSSLPQLESKRHSVPVKSSDSVRTKFNLEQAAANSAEHFRKPEPKPQSTITRGSDSFERSKQQMEEVSLVNDAILLSPSNSSQVSNELTILSDELNSLSFGINIVKDGQDDSLQGFESIIDHTQSPTLTISSTISIEDRTSDGNTTVDTSGGCSHYIPVVGIDADVHRDTTTDAQSPPAQSDDSTDDPAKLTFRQRLAKMEKSSLPQLESKRHSVPVKSSDSVRTKFNLEQAAANSAEHFRKPEPKPQSTITRGSDSFERSKQQMEEVSLVNDAILLSPSNSSQVSNELTILSDELNSLSFGIDIVKDGQDDSLQGFESIIDHTQSPTLTISSTISIEDRTSDGNTTVDTSGGCSHYIPVVGIDADVHRDTTTDAQSPPAQSDDSTDDPAKLTFRQRLAKMEKSSLPQLESKRHSVPVKSSDSVRTKFSLEQAAANSAEHFRKPEPKPQSTITRGSDSFERSKQQMEEVSLVNDAILLSPSNSSQGISPEKSSFAKCPSTRSFIYPHREMNASSKVSPTPSKREVSVKSSDSVRKSKLLFEVAAAKNEMNTSSKVSSTPSKREVAVKSPDSVRKSKLLFEVAAAKNAAPVQKPKPEPRSAKTGLCEPFHYTIQQKEGSSLGIDTILSSPLNAPKAAPVQTPKLEPRSAKTGLSKPFHYIIQQTEGSSLGIDTILSSPLNAPKDDGAHETSNPKRTNVKPSFEASKQIAESIKHKIAEGMRNSLGKKSSGDAGPNAMYSVQKPTTHDNAERRPAPTTREINRTAKDKTMVVAAIDFGTTYSAVAFSFKNDPERIICKHWDGQVKVPTAILLNPNKDVDSFGETAKVKFAEKFDDQNTYKDWFYFEHFKMKLYKMYLDRSVMLTDHSGKEMTAIDVFAKALSYMRKELLDLLNKERRGVVISPDSDIHWVLTVPAIWPDMSKTFMRQAAEMANIPLDYLTLVLEPEAASLYCRRDLGVSLRGKKYLVLDLGGGTADIVAHKIQNDDSIKECHMACGGEYGGKMVDKGIFKLLDELYGRDVINAFRQTKDYFEFCKEFEKAKRVYDGSKGIPLVLPASLNEIFKSKTGQSIEVSIEQSRLRGKVTWKRGSMNISTEFMKNIFDKPLNHILEATAKAINTIGHNETTSQATDTNAGVHHILMVGGFSNSSYIVEGLKQAYPESGFVLIPEEPSIAVIKGAVRFGQEPRAIESRMSKYTYGIGRMMKFKPGDREDFKVFANGTYWCDSCFNKHIEVGEELSTDERREVKAHDYYPPDAGVRQFILDVFASPEPNPRYTTDAGCQCIGRMRLDMDSHGDVWSKIEVKLVYTGTELEIQAYDVQNNKLTIGKVDFLG